MWLPKHSLVHLSALIPIEINEFKYAQLRDRLWPRVELRFEIHIS